MLSILSWTEHILWSLLPNTFICLVSLFTYHLIQPHTFSQWCKYFNTYKYLGYSFNIFFLTSVLICVYQLDCPVSLLHCCHLGYPFTIILEIIVCSLFISCSLSLWSSFLVVFVQVLFVCLFVLKYIQLSSRKVCEIGQAEGNLACLITFSFFYSQWLCVKF